MAEGHCSYGGYSTCMTWDDISARITYDATMASVHISATMTHVMWREEHLWNISVLQGLHLPILVHLTKLSKDQNM
jgi:hypothetical protein